MSQPVFTTVLCARSVSAIKQFICFLDSRRKQSVLNMMEMKKHLAAQEGISLRRRTAATPKQRQKQTAARPRQSKENVLQNPAKLPHLLQRLKQSEKWVVVHAIVCSVNLLTPVQRFLVNLGERNQI